MIGVQLVIMYFVLLSNKYVFAEKRNSDLEGDEGATPASLGLQVCHRIFEFVTF